MLRESRIVAFVATADADRARAFYQGTIGLQLVDEDPFALVFDANGVMLRIQKVPALTPQAHTALGWDVPDIRAVLGALTTKGVVFERYPRLVQDELGIWTSPSGAKVAWFKDPDGNNLSLTEFPA